MIWCCIVLVVFLPNKSIFSCQWIVKSFFCNFTIFWVLYRLTAQISPKLLQVITRTISEVDFWEAFHSTCQHQCTGALYQPVDLASRMSQRERECVCVCEREREIAHNEDRLVFQICCWTWDVIVHCQIPDKLKKTLLCSEQSKDIISIFFQNSHSYIFHL